MSNIPATRPSRPPNHSLQQRTHLPTRLSCFVHVPYLLCIAFTAPRVFPDAKMSRVFYVSPSQRYPERLTLYLTRFLSQHTLIKHACEGAAQEHTFLRIAYFLTCLSQPFNVNNPFRIRNRAHVLLCDAHLHPIFHFSRHFFLSPSYLPVPLVRSSWFHCDAGWRRGPPHHHTRRGTKEAECDFHPEAKKTQIGKGGQQ